MYGQQVITDATPPHGQHAASAEAYKMLRADCFGQNWAGATPDLLLMSWNAFSSLFLFTQVH